MHKKLKKYSDIIIHLVNPESNGLKEVNIWDGISDAEKKELFSSFIIGSVRIWSTSAHFFYADSKINIGDKVYNLIHYLTKGSLQEAIIYNFDKGWLAPLNIPASFDKPILIKIPPSSMVTISISTIW